MMEAMPVLTALGSAIPFAFASGLNVYATIAAIGISSRYGLVTLPDQFRAFDHPIIIGVAVGLYLVEFVADKIPWLDSLWDMVHTRHQAVWWRAPRGDGPRSSHPSPYGCSVGREPAPGCAVALP